MSRQPFRPAPLAAVLFLALASTVPAAICAALAAASPAAGAPGANSVACPDLVAHGVWSAFTLEELAGSYYLGNGLGVNKYLEIDANGRFSFRWRGCLGSYAIDEGTARIEAAHLILVPARADSAGVFVWPPGIDVTRYLPIRWGPRIYLLEDDGLASLCNDINAGWEPRRSAYGRCYLRRADWEKAVHDSPALPQPWPTRLLEETLHGTITTVVDSTSAWIDLGAEDGVWPEMEFIAAGDERIPSTHVVVGAVEAQRACVQIVWDRSHLFEGERICSSLADCWEE